MATATRRSYGRMPRTRPSRPTRPRMGVAAAQGVVGWPRRPTTTPMRRIAMLDVDPYAALQGLRPVETFTVTSADVQEGGAARPPAVELRRRRRGSLAAALVGGLPRSDPELRRHVPRPRRTERLGLVALVGREPAGVGDEPRGRCGGAGRSAAPRGRAGAAQRGGRARVHRRRRRRAARACTATSSSCTRSTCRASSSTRMPRRPSSARAASSTGVARGILTATATRD